MIGLIGYQDEVIGFGLAGITSKIELTRAATKEDVLTAVHELAPATQAILINESLHDLIKNHKETSNLILIDIPEQTATTNLDEIETLIKETLGISMTD